MFAYNFSKNEWKELENFGLNKPTPRFGHSLTLLNEYYL